MTTGIYAHRPLATAEHARSTPRRSRIAARQFSPVAPQRQRHPQPYRTRGADDFPQVFRRLAIIFDEATISNATFEETSRVRRKEISMRLMKPTIVTIDLQLVMQLCRTWRSEYETDGTFD